MQTNTRLKIGIFGGSFNPPTTAHAALTHYAHKLLELDQIWWLIAPHNPLKDKKDLAPFADRMAMCELAAQADSSWLKISDLEHQFGTQQTADTLDKIIERFPQHEFVWLMGTDNLVHFHSWNRWHDIVSQVPVYIFARPGDVEIALNSPASVAMGAPVSASADLSALRPGQWALLANQEMDVAATRIRKAIAAGEKPDNILPIVLNYIQDRSIYRAGN